ncbi:Uncharacterized protein PCOAH_00046620 [Plasmodium coatneyi]|uniref:RRM domain-containing protein n=1 Tax=Plasmodium coatneyi TaxID=208452 RepID=A0A1B1E589_9APIC|nr:Uncharacterized protein PCOAH_00046620 [Plasmodium coatneyi]ANQ10192.1 Uncharacterized protein PCOAH_00046620 [Plasmodium coatneyi]
MTDVQIQNQTSLNTSKKEFESRYDERGLRILCVKNISKETKESELLDLFQKFGSIESISLKVNTSIGPYAIYAHVLFSAPEEAKRCLKQMNGKFLNGRALRIYFERYNNNNNNNNTNNNNKVNDVNDEDESGVSNNYPYLDGNNNSSNNNGSHNANMAGAANGNKFNRNINRNNQFYNKRYPSNSKRTVRNDGILNNDSVNPYDPGATGFREYEHVNKRLRTVESNSMDNVNFGSGSSLLGHPNVNGNDMEISKLMKTYEENKMLNNPPGDGKNRQMEEMLQFGNKDGMNKPPRVKLYLCVHLRKCAQHVFNRPAVDISTASNAMSSTPSSNIPSNEFKGNTHMNMNASATNPAAPMYPSGQNNPITGGMNSSTLKEPSKNYMPNNGIANKEGQLHGNDKLQPPLHSGGCALPNMGLNNPTSSVKYALWKGTVEMKNKENLSVIGYALNGNVKNFLNSNISSIVISHRKKMKTLPKIEATYYFQIENKEDENILDAYRDYFNSKDRVGLSSTSDDWHMYLIFPGCPIFKEFCNSVGGINSSNNFNNIFLGVVCYNPQVSEKKNGVPMLGTQPQDGGVATQDNTAANFNQQQSPMTNVNRNNYSNVHGDFAKQGGGGPNNAVSNNFPHHSNTFNNAQGVAVQNNSTTQLNRENDPSSNESSEPTGKEENKNEVPNWLNQFSSLAAYLVKK